MAFVDEVTIYAEAGKGGDGVVRWLRTRTNARGGPAGGDGGKGGAVILIGARDLAALARYRHEKKFHAEDGEAGKSRSEHGGNGADLLLSVPIGTLARVAETGDEHEIIEEGERILLFRGGAGGFGNAHFKSSTNQNPFQQTFGKAGKSGHIELTLKMIADAGLIGLPNAGKSSLINALTRAKSKVGAYPFTTLEPHLGVFSAGGGSASGGHGYILADIPGLIEGASSGRGLGIKFLKHIERTKILLHLVSAEQDDPIVAYREVREELKFFGHELDTKKEIVILSKADLVSPMELKMKRQLVIRETGKEPLAVSIKDARSLKAFVDRLSVILS